jgi:hypothetical protein
MNIVILPLEVMPSLGFSEPITNIFITSIVLNCITSFFIQIHVARTIQSSKSEGASSPI